ncbi:hypothetical protein JZ751_004101 [Albula glossodonta]|uniref:HTH CENPB-type domain-containing protein n=1 Tax=Albula glossodonta TaxID=121402 RepID=A0A8T2P8Q4_9TELE|nr:hypothetical protein JZ751_004101 [Albula glossodonta]
MTSTKRKRVTLSIDKKLEILSKLDKGACLATIAKEYNVGKSTVFDIKKHQDKIKQFAKEATDSRSLKRRCIIRKPDDEKFDKAMHLWYSQARASGAQISGAIIMKKAKMMYAEMYPEREDGHFKASSGWLHRFKGRHCIGDLSSHADTLSADPNVAGATIKRFIDENNLTSDQVFNCAETVLYWRLLPEKAFPNGSEKLAKKFKSSKDRVTLMATANASGDFRLPLVFVHTNGKPNCFADVTMSALPCHYYSQRGAWMSGNIFSDWFLSHFVTLVKEYLKRKSLPLRAILLMDNTPPHHAAENLVSETDDGCIQCMFLPSNVTSLIQPMDQGILENLKRRYKRDLLRKLSLESDAYKSYTDFCEQLTVKDALYMCAKAWGEISAVSLRRSWRKLLPCYDVEEDDVEEEDDVHFTEDHQKLSFSSEAQEEWLRADKDEGTRRTLTDQEIIQRVCESAAEADSDKEEQDIIPHAVAEVCLVTTIKWLEQQYEASPTDLLMLRELHSLAARKRELDINTPVSSRAWLANRNLPELVRRHWIRQEDAELSGRESAQLAESDTDCTAPELSHIEDLIKLETDSGEFHCDAYVSSWTVLG